MQRIYLVAMVCGLFLTACNDDNVSPEQQTLNQNRLKWDTAAITSYVYHLATICFCPVQETRVIIVENGVVTNAFYTPSGTLLSADRIGQQRTIDDFFAVIQDGIDNSFETLEVTYNVTYGFPERISIDQSLMIADEEITYVISSFQ